MTWIAQTGSTEENPCFWRRPLNLLPVALVLAMLLSPISGVSAQDEAPAEDEELVRRYAPVLYFHPAEVFRPQSVDVMVNTARLQQARRYWLDINVLPQVSISDMLGFQDGSYVLDAWYGDDGSSDYKNYSAHRAYYQEVLSPEAGGPPVVTYAHVVRDEDPDHITIQYWLFYYYNDWFNKHEGDWEMVQVVLTAAGQPEWVVLSQHHGGTRRPWSGAQIEAGTHPAVFVALGSHANYFWGDETYPNGAVIGNARVVIMDRTGGFGRIIPEVILTPGTEEIEAGLATWGGLEWVPFAGHWGELAPLGDFGGPLGPAHKGEQWERPYAWGMAQSLDGQAWYANRLRVEVTGEAAPRARVTLRARSGEGLAGAESLGSLALLHREPTPGAVILADIEVPPGMSYNVIATWPDVEASQVTRYRFEGAPPSGSGRVALELRAQEPPRLSLPGSVREVRPTSTETETVAWDAPDVVWVGGILPASDVVKGVTWSLLAGLLPTLLYVGALYWTDRYEKEPTRLLAVAFFWGAIPALLVAGAVLLFFRLPADLLGPQAIEAVRAGLLAPLIEEALKGAVVLYIARRYRREFDNVLDGIIYGAMVGFGFAMTGNTLSYLGAFLLRGFAGLGSTIFVEGVLYGLDHAFYSAIFGAGLGFARLARRRFQRWAIPLAAFAASVGVHGLHNLAVRTALGLNPLTVAVTWAGIFVILIVMAWSLRRQRRCQETELVGQVPEALYRTLLAPGGAARAQWRALGRGGISAWRRMRRVHQLCAELAFKRMQARRFPEEAGIAAEAEALRDKVGELQRSLETL